MNSQKQENGYYVNTVQHNVGGEWFHYLWLGVIHTVVEALNLEKINDTLQWNRSLKLSADNTHTLLIYSQASCVRYVTKHVYTVEHSAWTD